MGIKESVTILGSTGSIGCNTLDVIGRHCDRFEVYALSAHSQVEKLAEQCRRFQPKIAVVSTSEAAEQLRQRLPVGTTEVLYGKDALCQIAQESDTVMASIVGAAGLEPTFCAAQHGRKILLANKETLVMAGDLFMQTAMQNGAQILPVDSEHNAIFQVLEKSSASSLSIRGVSSIILTASGGPFWQRSVLDFDSITVEEALRHPRWTMGRKISIDSATMMNKGLEVIEAHHLFQMSRDKIEVLIHPQSIIHSMVRYDDGSVLAQLGQTDMRIPIACALGFPERIASGVESLDFTKLSDLQFFAPDFQKFPCLQAAFDALKMGGYASCTLNAANEIAVAAFLNRQICFGDIARINLMALTDMTPRGTPQNIHDLIENDCIVRQRTRDLINKGFQ